MFIVDEMRSPYRSDMRPRSEDSIVSEPLRESISAEEEEEVLAAVADAFAP